MNTRNVLAGFGVIALAFATWWAFDRLRFMYWDVVDAAERIVDNGEG